MAGLTPTGFDALRASDLLTIMQDEYRSQLAALGLPSDVDFERDTIAGLLLAATSVQLGQLWESMQAVYDGTDPVNAAGLALDNIGALRGIIRLGATYTRAELDLTGTAGTIIPAGRIFEGGGPDNASRWISLDTVTLPATVEVQAADIGEIVAAPDTITTIITPVVGLTGATNPASAVPGRDREQDPEYRLRQATSLQAPSGRSVGALRALLLTLDGVQSVSVLENRSGSAAVVEGVPMDSHSVLPFIAPDTLTASQQEAVALEIWNWGPAGIRVGYSGGTDVELEVTGDGLAPATIGWNWFIDLEIEVVVTVVLLPGFALADVSAQITSAITAYIDSRGNQTVYHLQTLAVVALVEGVADATVTLNGFESDIVPTVVQRAVTLSVLVQE